MHTSVFKLLYALAVFWYLSTLTTSNFLEIRASVFFWSSRLSGLMTLISPYRNDERLLLLLGNGSLVNCRFFTPIRDKPCHLVFLWNLSLIISSLWLIDIGTASPGLFLSHAVLLPPNKPHDSSTPSLNGWKVEKFTPLQ